MASATRAKKGGGNRRITIARTATEATRTRGSPSSARRTGGDPTGGACAAVVVWVGVPSRGRVIIVAIDWYQLGLCQNPSAAIRTCSPLPDLHRPQEKKAHNESASLTQRPLLSSSPFPSLSTRSLPIARHPIWPVQTLSRNLNTVVSLTSPVSGNADHLRPLFGHSFPPPLINTF